MSDIMPNLVLRKAQIEVRISELRLNLQRMDVRKLELDDERTRIDANQEATHKALADLQAQLGE